MTPLRPMDVIGSYYGFSDLWLKDESQNPTGSFKARGMSMAVSKARELGIENCIVPTAGNAGGALAAYCAQAGMQCTVVMPRHTPAIFRQECELFGARLILVDGLIDACAARVRELNAGGAYFDVSTLKEPYRLEGKKTMGYEIAEQLNWSVPDVIVYPAGGGTGLIGIWKGLEELMELGWIDGPMPRMIAVQSENCAPVVHGFYDRKNWRQNSNKVSPSIANGLAVPVPFGMDMMLDILEVSGGEALAVSESEIVEGVREVAIKEGILLCPEGAAAWKGLLRLARAGRVDKAEKIVVLNTGSGYKYLENIL
jgi:threonine synthase